MLCTAVQEKLKRQRYSSFIFVEKLSARCVWCGLTQQRAESSLGAIGWLTCRIARFDRGSEHKGNAISSLVGVSVAEER